MAQIKDYSIITTINDSDLLLIQTSTDGAYKSIQASDLKTYFGSGVSSTTTGGTTTAEFPVTIQYRMNAEHVTVGSNPNLLIGTDDLSNNSAGGLAANQNYPTLVPNAVNGKPAISFNGNGQYIDLFSAYIIPDPGDFIIFQVIQYNSQSNGFGAGDSSWGVQMTSGNAYAVCNGSLVEADFPSVLGSFNIMAWGRYANRWTALVNGKKYDGGSNTSNLRGTVNGWERRCILGSKWDGSAMNYLNGLLCDTCVKLNPTTADINAIGNYYANQYKLNWVTVT